MPTAPVLWTDLQTAGYLEDATRRNVDAIQLADGRILVSWTTTQDSGPGTPAGADVVGQFHDPAGGMLGESFRLNSFHTGSNEEKLVMAAMPNGGFVTAYEDIAGNATSIRLEYFDASGTRLQHNNFVTDIVAGLPASEEPRIAVSDNGSVGVVYEYQSTGDAKEIVMSVWNPLTNAVSGPQTLSSSDGPDRDASIAVLNNGNFVVTWHNPSSGNGGIEARIVPPDGVPMAANFVVKDTYASTSLDDNPDVAALANGGFVIVWRNAAADDDVFFEIYDAAGVSQSSGSANIVLNTATDHYRDPQVVGLEDGGFAISMRDDGSYGDSTGFRRMISFDASGTMIGGLRINKTANTVAEAITMADGRVFSVGINHATGEIVGEFDDMRLAANTGGPGQYAMGTTSSESITVSEGTVAVYANRGNDQVFGASSDDDIYGANGRDVLFGANGNDDLFGGSDRDTLYGGAGNDHLNGNSGSDAMSGGLGNDFYIVDEVGDFVFGELAYSAGGGIDTVRTFVSYVQPENIELVRLGYLQDTSDLMAVGNDAPGTLVGNAGNNSLTGRGGNDQINGNDGDDRMIGNTGRDTLVGGAGADTFVYTSISESRSGATNRDVINGFDRGSDVIDLSTMDANLGLPGDAAFSFIGTGQFSGTAGELRLQGLGGPNAVIVEGDLRGDGVADFQIFVNLTTVLGADDFIL